MACFLVMPFQGAAGWFGFDSPGRCPGLSCFCPFGTKTRSATSSCATEDAVAIHTGIPPLARIRWRTPNRAPAAQWIIQCVRFCMDLSCASCRCPSKACGGQLVWAVDISVPVGVNSSAVGRAFQPDVSHLDIGVHVRVNFSAVGRAFQPDISHLDIGVHVHVNSSGMRAGIGYGHWECCRRGVQEASVVRNRARAPA
jgi:hypothetical protein